MRRPDLDGIEKEHKRWSALTAGSWTSGWSGWGLYGPDLIAYARALEKVAQAASAYKHEVEENGANTQRAEDARSDAQGRLFDALADLDAYEGE